MAAAQIQVLAVGQVIQQALITAMEDNAHIGDASVDHAGENEVDDAVAAGEGDGGGHAVLRQIPQVVVVFVGKNDAVQIFHLSTS